MISAHKDAKQFEICEIAADSHPRNFTDLAHFYANYYNQILTVMTKWNARGELSAILSANPSAGEHSSN